MLPFQESAASTATLKASRVLSKRSGNGNLHRERTNDHCYRPLWSSIGTGCRERLKHQATSVSGTNFSGWAPSLIGLDSSGAANYSIHARVQDAMILRAGHGRAGSLPCTLQCSWSRGNACRAWRSAWTPVIWASPEPLHFHQFCENGWAATATGS